jgi:hypothetical protein
MVLATWFSIPDLWLPILASGAAVFVLSFMMWMVFPHHSSDWGPMPDEDGTMAFLGDIAGGQYTFPHCPNPESWKDPEMIKKFEQGPSGFLIIRPRGGTSMGKSMLISFLFNVFVSVLVAYVLSTALPDAAAGMRVLRVASTTAFLGYAGALGWNAIWFNHSWSNTFKSAFDGLVYGLATGLIFMWLGPWS